MTWVVLVPILSATRYMYHTQVARLDHYFIPSTITRLWRRRETARVERFIIETLQDCGADDLNMILRRVKLGLLVYKLKDSEPMKSWADYAASFLFSPSTKGARTELVVVKSEWICR